MTRQKQGRSWGNLESLLNNLYKYNTPRQIIANWAKVTPIGEIPLLQVWELY